MEQARPAISRSDALPSDEPDSHESQSGVKILMIKITKSLLDLTSDDCARLSDDYYALVTTW